MQLSNFSERLAEVDKDTEMITVFHSFSVRNELGAGLVGRHIQVSDPATGSKLAEVITGKDARVEFKLEHDAHKKDMRRRLLIALDKGREIRYWNCDVSKSANPEIRNAIASMAAPYVIEIYDDDLPEQPVLKPENIEPLPGQTHLVRVERPVLFPPPDSEKTASQRNLDDDWYGYESMPMEGELTREELHRELTLFGLDPAQLYASAKAVNEALGLSTDGLRIPRDKRSVDALGQQMSDFLENVGFYPLVELQDQRILRDKDLIELATCVLESQTGDILFSEKLIDKLFESQGESLPFRSIDLSGAMEAVERAAEGIHEGVTESQVKSFFMRIISRWVGPIHSGGDVNFHIIPHRIPTGGKRPLLEADYSRVAIDLPTFLLHRVGRDVSGQKQLDTLPYLNAFSDDGEVVTVKERPTGFVDLDLENSFEISDVKRRALVQIKMFRKMAFDRRVQASKEILKKVAIGLGVAAVVVAALLTCGGAAIVALVIYILSQMVAD